MDCCDCSVSETNCHITEICLQHRRVGIISQGHLKNRTVWSLGTTKRPQTHTLRIFFFSFDNPVNQRCFSFWQPSSLFLHFSVQSFFLCVYVSGFTRRLWAAQTLTSCGLISKPSSASLLPFLLGSRPRASASSKVVVRGLPRVSGNNNVSTPIMNARIPTMS